MLWSCRFVDSVAFREYERTGKMQFTEFGTSVPLLKGLTNTFKGLLNLGQGTLSASATPMPPFQHTGVRVLMVILPLSWLGIRWAVSD